MIRLAPFCLAVLLLAVPAMAADQPAKSSDPVAASVRVGDHPGFGRIVFDVQPSVRYQTVREGDKITVHFSDQALLRPPPAPPRNVVSLRVMPGQADIVVAPGTTARDVRYDGRVVIDVFDAPNDAMQPSKSEPRAARPAAALPAVQKNAAPPPDKHGASSAQAAAPKPETRAAPAPMQPTSAKPKDAPAETKPETASASAAKPMPDPAKPIPDPPAQAAAKATPTVAAVTETPIAAPKPPNEPAAAPNPDPVAPVQPVVPPPARAAAPMTTPSDGVAFTVPMGPQSGAALFQRAGTTYIVFDERRTINLAALHDDNVFGNATAHELQAGTLIELHAPPRLAAALTRVPRGWKVAMQPTPPQPRPMEFAINGDKIALSAESPGSVVSMADPVTGATLLVGTTRRPGQAVLTARHLPELTLMPSDQGVVVEPLGDAVTLRTVPAGFEVSSEPAGLAITPKSAFTEASRASSHLTRRFNLPILSADALGRRMTRGIAEAAVTPPRVRGPKRRAVAETMLSLGLGAEAEALLRVTADQDPKEASSPETIGLTAVAALLAGRPDDAAGIDDPRLNGTDEIALWRAIRRAMQEEGSPRAAAVFASTGSLALLYPVGIRDHILPLVIETMILGGETAAAKRMMPMLGDNPAQDQPNLRFARALLKQASGDVGGALQDLDALTVGHDQLDRARAGVRAVELRLARGQIDAGQAADALDKFRDAWRGDRRELALRERIADLRQRAGGWRQALAELRSAEIDFPDHAPAIRAHLSAVFASLLEGEATAALPPLELVALVDENADLLRGIPESTALEARLADRLLALDLPKRAGPLLEKLAASAASGADRAEFGTRLAAMRLRENDAAGALAALANSAAPDLNPALTEKRAYLMASAQARAGDIPAAIATLAPLSGEAADSARASIYEQAGDWADAEKVLSGYVAAMIPEAGALTDTHRQALLRLATATARAGDEAGLAALHAKEDARMGDGPLANLFRLLTADPVRASGDLGRSDREVGLARTLPAGLQALKATAATP